MPITTTFQMPRQITRHHRHRLRFEQYNTSAKYRQIANSFTNDYLHRRGVNNGQCLTGLRLRFLITIGRVNGIY